MKLIREFLSILFDLLEIVGLFLVICWPIILIFAVRIGW